MNKKMILVSSLVLGLSAVSTDCQAGWFGDTWNKFKGTASSALNRAKTAISEHANNIKTAIVENGRPLLESARQAGSAALAQAKDQVSGLVHEAGNHLKQTGAQFVQDVKEHLGL
ncbi:MAG: hypothetical protein LBL30_00735 [Holosporales bacterium]|nr:hypothetical protein [Holosporales bacterium]